MVSKRLNKIVVVLMLFLSIINNTYANTIEEKLGTYNIYYHDDPISYVRYGEVRQKNYEYYYLNENGKEETVYCLELGAPGAEANNGYGVLVNEQVNDIKLASIIANAYPYKSLDELGLKTVSEARFAGQFAVWTYIDKLDLSKVSATEEEYQRVVDAINNIYNNGINSEYIPTSPVSIYATKNIATIDKIDSNYYSKEYTIAKNSNVESIILKSSNNDVIIVDENNKRVEELSKLQKFKVLIPVSSVKKDVNIELKFETKLKENVSLFGVSTIPNMQNVAITFSPMSNEDIDVNFSLKKVDSKIKIKKVDKDDENIKIEGVKFKISDSTTGKEYGEFVTDENGEIFLDMLDIGINKKTKIKIEEVEVPKGYYIDYDNNIKEIDIEFGKINEVVFKNQKIKGKIKIVKTSLYSNALSNISSNMPLEGAKFAVFDMNGNKVDELITDKDGVAISKELEFGKYKLKEVEAPKYYRLNDKEIEFEILKNGEEILINIKNDNIQIPKRLPNTGC